MGNLISIGNISTNDFLETVDLQRAILISGLRCGWRNVERVVPGAEISLTLSVSIRFNEFLIQDREFKGLIETSLRSVYKGTMSAWITHAALLDFLYKSKISDKVYMNIANWENIERIHIQWSQLYSGRKLF